MAAHIFTVNEEWNAGIEAKTGTGYMAMVYASNGGAGLGGGELRVFTTIDGIKTPVPDSKLSAADIDGNGDAIQQVIFSTAGNISVALSGATSPNITVALK